MGTAPEQIRLHRRSGVLELTWSGGERCELDAEFLRVHSPSAEVRGHGRADAVLQTGKRGVGIRDIEPTGRYAIRILFDDGHESGIYSWEYLHELCHNHATLWQRYLEALREAGARRDPLPEDVQAINIMDSSNPDTDRS
ncbi:MAG: gamma-butyrobetaine hydroxylase-like domain-containing protein [Pseudomonadota bacterium]